MYVTMDIMFGDEDWELVIKGWLLYYTQVMNTQTDMVGYTYTMSS